MQIDIETNIVKIYIDIELVFNFFSIFEIDIVSNSVFKSQWLQKLIHVFTYVEEGCRGAGVPGCRGAGVPGCRGTGGGQKITYDFDISGHDFSRPKLKNTHKQEASLDCDQKLSIIVLSWLNRLLTKKMFRSGL